MKTVAILVVAFFLSMISHSYAQDEVCQEVFNGDELHFSLLQDRAFSYQIHGKIWGYDGMSRAQTTLFTISGWGKDNIYSVEVHDSRFTHIGSGQIKFWKSTVSECPSIRAGCYREERNPRRVVPGQKAELTFGGKTMLFDCAN